MLRDKLKVLVLSDFQGNDANVIRDFLYSFHQHSRHEYFYLHRWKRNHCQRLRHLNLDSFDVILLFWDYFWPGIDDPASTCFMPPWAIDKIGHSTALKVQFLQDEYRDVRQVNRIMARLGVNLMFTCVAERDHELFYPKAIIPSLHGTYSVLTGYVPRYLRGAAAPPLLARPIDIGYRSRQVPFYLGSLGHEKVQIAHNFQRIGKLHGLTTDISVREEDRIYGARWLDFLRASRYSIGTESGASVVDFDGAIRRNTIAFVKANPAATFDEVKQHCFADSDGKAVIQTISPRVFEAAAFGNTLVLHEGEYAKIIEPDVHFVSVRKDYSNIDAVVERMKDLSFCQRLAERAREDLIQSGAYDYQKFAERFDVILDDHRPTKTRRGNPSRVLFYSSNYLHTDCIVPVGKACRVVPHPLHLAAYFHATPSFPCVLLSLQVMLDLLASNRPLLRRLVKWLIDPSTAAVSLGGLARDLRILALLGCARNGVYQVGNTFEVHVDHDEANGQMTFRSVPPDGRSAERKGNECQLLGKLRSGPALSSLAWDHSAISDSFLVGRDKDRFFTIFINPQRVYYFKQLHELFKGEPREELQTLEEVLVQPCERAGWPSSLLTLVKLGAALGFNGLIRKPWSKLGALARRGALRRTG